MTHSFPTRRSSDLRARWSARNISSALFRRGQWQAVRLLNVDRRVFFVGAEEGVEDADESIARRSVRRVGCGNEFGVGIAIGQNQRRSGCFFCAHACAPRSEEHTSELQSLMRISYAVFCLKKKNKINTQSQII